MQLNGDSNAKSEAWHGESRRRSRGSATRHFGSYQKGTVGLEASSDVLSCERIYIDHHRRGEYGENLVVHWECSMIMNPDPSGV